MAVRTGPTSVSEEPDNVLQPLTQFTIGLFASPGYLERNGVPETVAALKDHCFVALDDANQANSARLYKHWLNELAPEARIVFRSTNLSCVDEAILQGIGLGFFPTFEGEACGLVRVLPQEFREGQLNLVTHVDLHRTERVQQLLGALKEHVPRTL